MMVLTALLAMLAAIATFSIKKKLKSILYAVTYARNRNARRLSAQNLMLFYLL